MKLVNVRQNDIDVHEIFFDRDRRLALGIIVMLDADDAVSARRFLAGAHVDVDIQLVAA